MKDNIIVAAIVAIALIVSALFIQVGMEKSAKTTLPEMYSLFGYEGVVYRLNNVNGRIDVLVPSNEAALLFPVGQIQLPSPKDKLTDEQKAAVEEIVNEKIAEDLPVIRTEMPREDAEKLGARYRGRGENGSLRGSLVGGEDSLDKRRIVVVDGHLANSFEGSKAAWSRGFRAGRLGRGLLVE